MNKIIIEAAVTVFMFFAVWQGLAQIDWINVLFVEIAYCLVNRLIIRFLILIIYRLNYQNYLFIKNCLLYMFKFC